MIQNQNKFKGEPLLVVGTGGSLKDTPLDKIKMKSFSMNRIGLIFDQTEWRPDFFFCITYRVRMSPAYCEDVYKVIRTGIPSFIGNRIKPEIFGYDNIEYVDALHIGKKFAFPKLLISPTYQQIQTCLKSCDTKDICNEGQHVILLLDLLRGQS